MLSRFWFVLALVLLGVAYSHTANTNARWPVTKRSSLTEFLNGIIMDVSDIFDDMDDMSGKDERRRGDRMFRDADRGILRDPEEMNFRQIFSRSSGNEFIDTDDLAEVARIGVNQLGHLIDSVGIDAAKSFDVDGNPTDPGVSQVSRQRTLRCPYDRANSMPCNDTFKEPTGRCTNLMNGKKTWGMAGTPFSRVLPPMYEDGIGAKRLTGFKSGETLESARTISSAVTTNTVILNSDGFDSQIMQWGQYIAHEFSHLAETEADAACCPDQIFSSRNRDGAVATQQQRAQIREEIRQNRGDVCIQIEIENDPVHGGYVCMTQTRSKPAPLHDCSIGPRQQMNSITHVFDGSVVYGSSKAEQDSLRTFSGGKMKTQTVNGRTLPPQDVDNCPAAKKSISRCPFKGGDTRINTTPNLMSMHTVSLVHHNKMADSLARINPHWKDERIFQETRRIVSAIDATIHYYEYLPLIMGESMIKKYQLNSYAGFDPKVNPSVLSEMAHGAMRFGHSTVGGFFTVVMDNGTQQFTNLQPNFFNSDFLYQGGIQQCIKGLQADRPWIIDRNFPTQMRDFLFDSRRDIISLNINRGRDHGLQSYTSYRRHYGLSVPKSFDDLSATHSSTVIAALRRVYKSVEDVELYPGGVTENHVAGGLVGELFANILGDGFSRLLKGDRLWYEGPNSGLTPAQIREIRNYKFHQLLCDGADLDTVSDHAFLTPGRQGAKEVSCSSLPKLNLRLWRDQPPSTPQCEWKVVETSPCCFGEQTVTRECVGDAGCECPGEEEVNVYCTCRGPECFRAGLAYCTNKWKQDYYY